MQTILITGATSGIGLATAELLANQNYRLILCGRRKERLEELSIKISAKAPVHLLVFDVSQRKQVVEAIKSLPPEFKNIDILLNNAGNAHGFNHIQDGDMDDWEAMIDINIKGLLYMTREILPGMVARKSGHVINIGSIAGIETYERGNVYCASKAAVNALSQGMRIDLNESGIKVSEIKPGAVNTEFSAVRFKGNQEKSEKVYEGFTPLIASDIAEIIHFVITRPAHVNIADLLVLPLAQASATKIHRGKP